MKRKQLPFAWSAGCTAVIAWCVLSLGLSGQTASAQAPTPYTRIQPAAPDSDDEIFLHFLVMDPCGMDVRITGTTVVDNVITISVDQRYVGPPVGFSCLSPPPDGVTRTSLGSLPAGNYIARIDHWAVEYDQSVGFVVLQAPIPIPVGGIVGGVVAVLLMLFGAHAHEFKRQVSPR